jgi:hypothetical protein
MGWSCTRKAGDVAEAWREHCVAQTGASNTYRAGDKQYFFEIGREQDDGAIVGSIFRMEPEPNGDGFLAYRSGSFRIAPDGRIVRAPKALKDAAASPKHRCPACGAHSKRCQYDDGGRTYCAHTKAAVA